MVKDQHDEQLQAIEVNRKLCPTNVNWQNMEDLRRGELLNHKKKVKALEKKNMDQETKHVRMITMLDKVVDSQDNQLRHQKFELRELEKKFQQEMKEMKEDGDVQLREQEMEHRQEVDELKQAGAVQLHTGRRTGWDDWLFNVYGASWRNELEMAATPSGIAKLIDRACEYFNLPLLPARKSLARWNESEYMPPTFSCTT